MARQHGYFLLIPAFVPVDKNSLQNQLAAGQVIHEAAQKRDLSAIMALEGIRYHAQYGRDGAVKDLHVRWGSKEVEEQGSAETAQEAAEDEAYSEQTAPVPYNTPVDDYAPDEPAEESASARKRREARERAAA